MNFDKSFQELDNYYNNSNLLFSDNWVNSSSQEDPQDNYEEKENTIPLFSIDNKPNFIDSTEIPIEILYFNQPINANKNPSILVKKEKNEAQTQISIQTHFTKFTKTIYKWKDIKNCINLANGFSEDIVNIINEYDLPGQCDNSLDIFYLKKKRKNNIETNNTTVITNPKGRITDEDKSKGKSGKHNKFDPDNMIKKCKRIFIYNAQKHINIYLNEEKKYEQLLDLE